jgi:ribosomal protein L25 (general stress protein Ctc)
MSADEMRGLVEHFKLIGTSWSERMRQQNEPIKDVYPNRTAPVVIEKDGKRIVREDIRATSRNASAVQGVNLGMSRHTKGDH